MLRATSEYSTLYPYGFFKIAYELGHLESWGGVGWVGRGDWGGERVYRSTPQLSLLTNPL
jgi:hypothetical protein